MAFQRPTLQELINRIQSDLASRMALGSTALRRSLINVFARVYAGAAHMLHGHLEFISRQQFPDQSEAEFLERQGELFGINRIAAAYAGGDVTFTGTNGTVIPEATVLQRSDGAQYSTDAEGTIASGTATVAVTALVAGEDGNADLGVSLTLVSPITGVLAAATVATGGLTDGTDEETDASLRARVINRMQQPPHGGADFDYVTWAKEVSGVTRAWVYPQELGLGTVTVRFVTDDTPGGPIPSGPKVTEVQAYIDAARPVTADVTVAAPVAVPLDFEIELDPDAVAIRTAVEAELTDLLRREAEPGGTILISHIREAISVAAGEYDHTLVSPVANVDHATGEMATMGDVTWS